MSLASLTEPLDRVALFQGLQPDQIEEIARRSERLMRKPGEAIITEGDVGTAAYVIVSGSAMRTAGPGLEDDEEPLGPGTIIGEMAMLVETTYSSTVVCNETTRLLRITRDSLLEQMATDLALADHLIAKLSSRLKALANELRRIDGTLAKPAEARSKKLLPVKLEPVHGGASP